MKYSTYCMTAGIIFTIVAIVHLSRIVQGWEIVIDGTLVPLWVNWAGLIVSGVLAYYGLWLGIKKPIVNLPPT